MSFPNRIQKALDDVNAFFNHDSTLSDERIIPEVNTHDKYSSYLSSINFRDK